MSVHTSKNSALNDNDAGNKLIMVVGGVDNNFFGKN